MLKLRKCFVMPIVSVIPFVIAFLCFCFVAATEPVPYGNDSNAQTLAAATTKTTTLEGKLVFAHVIFRHGDRTIIEPYPTDPWRNLDSWPTGWGQLTNLGKQQHYDLGLWLRKRYQTLLSNIYDKDEIYIQSTDVDRALMSALSNLAGLYRPVGKDVWRDDIKWQPIPVHTIPEDLDATLSGKASCPAYDYAFSELQNTSEFQKINERYKYLFDYLTQYTGRIVESLDGIQRINNTLFIEKLFNKTLPDWTNKVYLSADMTYISNFAFAIKTYTAQLARLKTGPLIKEMLHRFSEKAKGKLNPNRSVWIYSAHDTTIANVLNTLKLFDLHSPPYTACVMLELRLDAKNNPYVSIFYKNTTAEPKPMEIPNCGTACPLDKMFLLYKDILPVDWAHECQLSTMELSYEDANIGQAMAILIAIIICMLLMSYITMIYYRRRSYRLYSAYAQMA